VDRIHLRLHTRRLITGELSDRWKQLLLPEPIEVLPRVPDRDQAPPLIDGPGDVELASVREPVARHHAL
jgi:hypothetical protein